MSGFSLSTTHLTKEFWETIACAKRDFIQNGIDPRTSKAVRLEVADSWVKSHQTGLLPQDGLRLSNFQEQEQERFIKENRLLINVAMPIIDNYTGLATFSGYTLQLFSKDCYHLAGTRLNHIDVPEGHLVRNMGTTAHSLAVQYNRPFQLVGAENYLEVLHNTVSSAAPIVTENGTVIGALALLQDLGENPWDHSIGNVLPHLLGWISSLAFAISSQIKLYMSNEKLHKANDTLSVTFELFNEGIITIEPGGRIVRANRTGRFILDLSDHDIGKRSIFDFLVEHSNFLDNLNKKKNIDYAEEKIRVRNEENPYLISLRPIFNKQGIDDGLTILKLNYPSTINSLIARRSGTGAQYNIADIIGRSQPLMLAKSKSLRFAKSNENILLLGESGTGKELFAQAIHNNSRADGPFIAVNCAAMPRNLIESELFGYERGAFTGAEKSGRPGKIELADGGTLFLDEIGDMPYELQVVILRVLQDKQVMRLGGKTYQKVDFRLIAATNQNLEKLILEKAFREDLYFRLSVLTIEIPPLRDRANDITILAEHFVHVYAKRIGRPTPKFSPLALQLLNNYDWPGNVRQLENAMIYAVNMADQQIIEPHHLPQTVKLLNQPEKYKLAPPNSESFSSDNDLNTLKYMEKAIFENALAQSGNRVSKAAKILGVSKSTIYRKARQYNLEIGEPD